MAHNITVVAMILIVLSPFGLIIWWAIAYQRKQRKQAWQQCLAIADALHIPFPSPDEKQMRGSSPGIHGESKGRHFTMYQIVKGSGKSRTYYTNFVWKLTISEVIDIHMYKENFFSRLGSYIGLKDVQTGFEGFDKKYILISNNENFAMKLFSNEVCNVMEDIHPSIRATMSLNNNRIEYSEQGIITNEKNRERFLKLILAARLLADKAEKGFGGRG